MGCDGGSIPKRKEIVKRKATKEKPDKEAELIYKWGFCSVSDESLRRPIVSTAMGDLMNKEGAIKHLLDYRDNLTRAYDIRVEVPGLNTFNSIKDIKELKMTDATKEADKGNTAGPSTTRNADGSKGTNKDGELKWAKFACPITNLEMNGRYKFMFSWKCGCVVSERALKEVPNENKCIVCQEPYEEYDLVIIHPETNKDIDHNQAALMARFMARQVKKNKLKNLEEGEPTSQSSEVSAKSSRRNLQFGSSPISKRRRNQDDGRRSIEAGSSTSGVASTSRIGKK